MHWGTDGSIVAFVHLKEIAMYIARLKSVFVCKYVRRRFGRIEHVCQHWRSHPGQLNLF